MNGKKNYPCNAIAIGKVALILSVAFVVLLSSCSKGRAEASSVSNVVPMQLEVSSAPSPAQQGPATPKESPMNGSPAVAVVASSPEPVAIGKVENLVGEVSSEAAAEDEPVYVPVLVVIEDKEDKAETSRTYSDDEMEEIGTTGIDGLVYSYDPSLHGYVVAGCNEGLSGQLLVKSSIDGIPVVGIGEGAFENQTGLEGDILLPSGIRAIGDYAFKGCVGFDGVLLLPEGLESIGKGAFAGCIGLKGDVFVPDSVTEMGECAFLICVSLDGNLMLGKGLESIPSYAFAGCLNLKGDVLVPRALKSLEAYSFASCKGLGDFVYADEAGCTMDDNAFIEVDAEFLMDAFKKLRRTCSPQSSRKTCKQMCE